MEGFVSEISRGTYAGKEVVMEELWHRIMESSGLKKIFKIIKLDYQPDLQSPISKPCPLMPWTSMTSCALTAVAPFSLTGDLYAGSFDCTWASSMRRPGWNRAKDNPELRSNLCVSEVLSFKQDPQPEVSLDLTSGMWLMLWGCMLH